MKMNGKGKRVDSIYTADPEKIPTAFALCQNNDVKLCLYNTNQDGNPPKVLHDGPIGTFVNNQ